MYSPEFMIEQVPACRDADEQARNEEQQEHEQVGSVVAAVEARDGLTHGVDAVGERKPGVQVLEEVRHHLDGVGARGSGDLENDEQHRDGLADVLEGHGDGVDEEHVDEALDHAREHERHGVEALDAEGDVSHAADDGLELADEVHEQPTAKEALPRLELADALLVNLELVDGHEYKASHPQGQVGVEGRHAAAVVGHRVDGGGDHVHGRAHEVSHLLGVQSEDVLQDREGLSALDGRGVGRQAAHLVRSSAHGVRGLGECVRALGEHTVELGEGTVCLGEHGGNGAREAHEATSCVREGVEGVGECRQRRARERALEAREALGTALHGVVHGG